MKKFRVCLALTLILFTFLQLGGCAVKVAVQEEISSDDEAQAIGLAIDDEDGVLYVGDYSFLDVDIKIDYRYALKWSSSNPEVATVDDNGRIDALSAGKTTITAKVEKSSIKYELTVKEGKADTVKTSNANVNSKNKMIVDQNKSNGKSMNLYSLYVNAETGCLTAFTYNSSDYYYLPVRSMVCSVAKNTSVYEDEDAIDTVFYQIGEKEEWSKEEDGNFYRYNTTIRYEDTEFKFTSCAYKSESPSSLVTDNYNKLGKAHTNGEIRLSAEDAKWIYDNCNEGTQVRIVTENAKDQMKRPEPVRIAENAKYQNWDPTDQDKKNPYFKVAPTFEGVEDLRISRGYVCDLYKGVEVFDTCMNSHGTSFKVDSNVLTDKIGKYIVTYYYTDSLGHFGRADRTVYVE